MDIHWPTFILLGVFAGGTWLGIAAIYSQLPLLVSVLPEGHKSFSLTTVITQVSNVSILSYALIRRFWMNMALEKWILFIILLTNNLILIVPTIQADKILYLGNTPVSLPLFSSTFILGFFSTLSTVVIHPFMGVYPPQYVTGFYIGLSAGNIVPSLLALVQGSNVVNISCSNMTSKLTHLSTKCNNNTQFIQILEGKLFSTKTFFTIMVLCTTVSLIAFISLNVVKSLVAIKIQPNLDKEKLPRSGSEDLEVSLTNLNEDQEKITLNQPKTSLSSDSIILLVNVFVIAMLSFAIILGMLSYTAGSYAYYTLSVSTNLYLAFQAFANLVMIKWTFSSRIVLSVITSLIFLLTIIMFVIALLAQKGILIQGTFGSVIVVCILFYIITTLIINLTLSD
ncbi:Solute carrier family 52, riboflavin transporter, member 3-A [Thelohanellus kitauei]|uniref:Riboflavin transporter n=1 Tax=Thelohanellus kitauei TaxID=669202 RepID=A0A0C2JVJ7_THEKT|nr:Solute carrier family 52, riboflavin transporter, member 3-A [Thelohanellus kitauei]